MFRFQHRYPSCRDRGLTRDYLRGDAATGDFEVVADLRQRARKSHKKTRRGTS